MKFLVSQLAYFVTERQMRRSVRALLRYLAFLAGVVLLYTILFHAIKLYVEGEDYSWITGLYWTLVTMSTLGFGDITFTTDAGRVFSIVVLMSGIVLLLIVLPFTFIRSFYAPWLEAQIRLQAPRAAPPQTAGHVIICTWDTIAPGLIERLKLHGVPYFLIEPDPAAASRRHGEGVSVVTGEIDSRATYDALRVQHARLVLANAADTTNTNITLTVQEAAPEVPVVAVAEDPDSVDILELSGCSYVLPLKQLLGEHLASRVDAGRPEAHVTGRFHGLEIAELPVRHTALEGQTIRETRLREQCGVSIVGVWERGRLVSVRPDLRLSEQSVPVIVGTAEQIARLDRLLAHGHRNPNPVLVIGGGKVGRAASRTLRAKGIQVNLLERNPALRERIGSSADGLFIGDAADRSALIAAGLAAAPSVMLTTNDDAMNIYLAVYCRRLHPELRIVSRITHERNIEAIHRAGADFVLTYASLGVEAVFSLLQGREPVILGENVDLFTIPVPSSLVGRTLADTGVGARTGLTIVALERDGHLEANPPSGTQLEAGVNLFAVGHSQQRQAFAEAFEKR